MIIPITLDFGKSLIIVFLVLVRLLDQESYILKKEISQPKFWS